MTRFYLGTHQPGWLNDTPAPLFVSDRRLRGYKTLPRATADWALDSGGFTELQYFGRWTVEPVEYIDRVRRYRDEVGRLAWAAPQDWMCEPIVIAGGSVGPMTFVGTGLSVEEHQRRTVDNLVQLRDMAPDLPWIPVIHPGLHRWRVRQVPQLLRRRGNRPHPRTPRRARLGVPPASHWRSPPDHHRLHDRGVTRLHGFGVKTLGLQRYDHLLTSADSMAWSIDARRKPPLASCVGRHKNCANCPLWGLSMGSPDRRWPRRLCP